MDILDRYLGYEAWTLRYFLVRCREVTPAQLHQSFDIGQGTLYETIAHIIGNLEVWTDLMHDSSGTAKTQRAGWRVALLKGNSPTSWTFELFSTTQSCPVMPQSK